MSRLDGRWAEVITGEQGQPQRFTLAGTNATVIVTGIRSHWREWLGALDGEPERDIWQVETPDGVCELHGLGDPRESLREPAEEEPEQRQWLLFKWED